MSVLEAPARPSGVEEALEREQLPADGVVVAVDGGGSKTDVVVLGVDGELLARTRGPGSNLDALGVAGSLEVIGKLVTEVLALVPERTVLHTGIYLSGIDLPAEIEAFSAALAKESWAVPGTTASSVVDNDLFALLRAGTNEPDAVAVVCGSGINAVGVRHDGASARFPALGLVSGDWGGGGCLGRQALWHAVRAEDGRGPATLLQELVPQAYGLSTVTEVVEGLHFNRLAARSVLNLTKTLFDAAERGDVVAQAEVDRQAEEIVTLVRTVIRRLDLSDKTVPVVLGGSVLAANRPTLMRAIAEGLREHAPNTQIELVTAPPILGAGMLALEAVSAQRSAVMRARGELDRTQ
ncbi:N-acetylglucosamine kinase [Arthrobacter sp. ERGS1:01]|uniref:N-acetylglucosamine kinase n=1 Tax=Arthrobacter sp. ERGS1:01 TaxID=1704044 RepID=UPI000AD9F970|nr:BadF/BadG/BcrA/BcrD ATPase family protein [Arthrobacter sp. ERGS1:01]